MFTYAKTYTLFLIMGSVGSVLAITEQSERPSITEAKSCTQAGNVFGNFSPYQFCQNMVASNMHFRYRVVTDLLEI